MSGEIKSLEKKLNNLAKEYLKVQTEYEGKIQTREAQEQHITVRSD